LPDDVIIDSVNYAEIVSHYAKRGAKRRDIEQCPARSRFGSSIPVRLWRWIAGWIGTRRTWQVSRSAIAFSWHWRNARTTRA